MVDCYMVEFDFIIDPLFFTLLDVVPRCWMLSSIASEIEEAMPQL